MTERDIDGGGNTGDDLWCVMLPSGESQRGTLDQLDEAFQAGVISADTLVLGPGETEWARLGALAGLEAQALADVIPDPIPVTANSLRPVTTALDDEPPVPEGLRPRSRFMMGAIAGLTLLGAGAIAFAMNVGASSTTSSNAASALTAPSAPVVKAPPVSPAFDAPAATASTASRLTEAQLKALADLDKQRERAADERQRNRPAASPATKRYKPEGPTFDVAPAHKAGKACTCKRGDPLCTCF